MNRGLIRLIIILLSAIIGWALGYIKVPYIERNYSYWLGFIACFATLGLFITILWEWNKNNLNKQFETKKPSSDFLKQTITKKFILISLVFISLLFCIVFIWLNNKSIKEDLNHAQSELNDIKYNANQEQQKNKIALLLDLINKLDSTKLDVNNKQERDKMMDRIATLSTSFKIHKIWDMENHRYQSLSAERGLLLLALLKTKMDTNYFRKLKENVSFYGADLRNADFQGLDLSGIDLPNANLEYANLQSTNLDNANLNGASLIGVNLNHASLVGANLISAKLNWAKINDADLHMAKLDSANFSNATVQKSKLNNASLIHAIMCNGIFYESNLDYCLMMYTNVSNANLTKTVLVNADLYFTNLGTTTLNDAIIHPDWMMRLKEKDNTGMDTILQKYQIVCDSIVRQDSVVCRLAIRSN